MTIWRSGCPGVISSQHILSAVRRCHSSLAVHHGGVVSGLPIVYEGYRGSDKYRRSSLDDAKVYGDDRLLQAPTNGSDRSYDAIELEAIKKALQSLEELHRTKEDRARRLKLLSNPWPDNINVHGRRARSQESSPTLLLPEAGAGPIPIQVFRQRLRQARGEKQIRKVLSEQLLRCSLPSEFLRLVSVALVHSRQAIKELPSLEENIKRLLFRCRINATDLSILRALNAIIWRLDQEGIQFGSRLLVIGAKFAARARSLSHMKRCLGRLRRDDYTMTNQSFRAIIAKFSIGHRGLGELRNGRWKQKELVEVLQGFPDCKHLPAEQQYHLGTFLVRKDWRFLHGWIAVLARCRQSQAIWEEWELWKASDSRRRARRLNVPGQRVTTRMRGDYWFVEQMAYSGNIELAWRLFEQTELPFSMLCERVSTALLSEPQHATKLDEEMKRALMVLLDTQLSEIEKVFGLEWVSGPSQNKGRHVAIEKLSKTLESLGENNWNTSQDFGYPWPDAPLVRQEDRMLHEAQEWAPEAVNGETGPVPHPS